MFGFGDFGTTKGVDHTEEAEEAVYKDFSQKREHRQYMNKRVAEARPPPAGT